MEDRVHVGRGASAEHHVLGDLLPHHGQRLNFDAVAFLMSERPAGTAVIPSQVPDAGWHPLIVSLQIAEDVVLGHPTAGSGAVNPGDVDVVLLRDAPDERGGFPLGHGLQSSRADITAVARTIRRGAGVRPVALTLSRRCGQQRPIPLRRERRAPPEDVGADDVEGDSLAWPIVPTTLLTGTVSPSATVIR